MILDRVRLCFELLQHLGEGEAAASELRGFARRMVPTAVVVAAEGFVRGAAHAIRLAGPEQGVGSQRVIGKILAEAVEGFAGVAELLRLVEALADAECHLRSVLVAFKLLDELLTHLSRDRVFLGFVEVVADANHHARNQRALRVRRGERDVSLQRRVEVAPLFVALSELVLRVRSQQVIGVVVDDLFVVVDRVSH